MNLRVALLSSKNIFFRTDGYIFPLLLPEVSTRVIKFMCCFFIFPFPLLHRVFVVRGPTDRPALAFTLCSGRFFNPYFPRVYVHLCVCFPCILNAEWYPRHEDRC